MKFNLGVSTQCHSAVLSMSFVVEKEILDYLTLVSEAQNKLVVTKCGVILHQMPQDW